MDHIIFAQADKNLGPVAVELPRDIKDGLTHLLDNTTESKVLAELEALFHKIQEWTVTFRRFLNNDIVDYIRNKLNTSRVESFGYFYLL